MESAKINDLFVIQTNSKLKAKEGKKEGQYPFYTSGEEIKYLDTFQCNTRGLIIGKGGNPNWRFANGMFSMSTDCCLLTAKQESVDIEYVYYYLCAFPTIMQRLYKGVGIKHISLADIKNIEIEYPPIEVQRTIVSVLSFLDAVIKKRQINVVKNIPELLKSYYSQLVDNNVWDKVRISDIATEIKSGPFGTQLHVSQFSDKGDIYVYGIDDLTKKAPKTRYLSIVELDKYKRYLVHGDDVLISIMGTVGRTKVVPKDIGLAINTKHLVDITLNQDLCKPYFLAYTLENDRKVRRQIESSKHGAVMSAINMSDVKNLMITLPSIKVQMYFEEVYHQVKDIQKCMEEEIQLLKELRKSLLAKYFRENNPLNASFSVTKKQKITSGSDIDSLLTIINKGGFSNLSNYDEMRSLLYYYIGKEVVEQYYDKKTKKVKLRKK
ncbi:restriction endonuclease subunit S [Segatella copri]|jgi:type I restriction enzyme S subunit|uniref:restriction endonuclease subunit S n=1 Tax=Segatella copri TaxID=165179 RepID=UPI002FEF2990